MKPKTQQVMLAKLRRGGVSFEPSTVDVEAKTVELRWYTGAEVYRYNWEHGTYLLSFSMEPRAVRLGRLKTGAPLLNSHSDWSLSDVVGVVEKARIEDGNGYATVRFSEREEVQPIFADVKAGIIRNVSMGAVVHQMKEVTEKGDRLKRFVAIDWEPMELSLVAIGADPGAQALSDQAERFPCVLHSGAAVAPKETNVNKIKVRLLADVEDVGKLGDIVEIEELEFDEDLHSKDLEDKKKPEKLSAVDDRSEDRAMKDALEADQKRIARLREIATHFELDELWIRRHNKRGSTVKEALADARRQAAKTEPEIDGRLKFGEDYQSIGWAVARMSEALSARAAKQPCPEAASIYARSTIAECAFGVLEKQGQTRGRALDPLRSPYDVVKLAMSNSDFPNILANVLNKTLLGAYQAATPSFRTFAQRRDFKDYRAHKFVRAGDFPLPLQVGEGGEITQGSMGEGSESVTALKYGRILAILWEVLVNDDLNAFTDFGVMVARRLSDFENATFYSLVINAGSGLGAAMSDSVAVYNAAHGNVNSGGALDNARLEEAFGLMASQTSIGSGGAATEKLKLNIQGRYVLTSPTSHILARRLLSPIFAAQASNVNAFAGLMEPIFDANISGTRYYVLADPANGSNYIYGSINGAAPRFEVRQGFEVEGVQVKVVADFGCGAIDFRYGVTGAGA